MKSRQVDYVTSNEEHVRLRILDGEIAMGDASADLLRIEKAQRASDAAIYEARLSRLHNENAELRRQLLGKTA